MASGNVRWIAAAVAICAFLLVAVPVYLTEVRDDASPQPGSPDDGPVISAEPADISDFMTLSAGETAAEIRVYTDADGRTAFIPSGFCVSTADGESMVNSGLVVIGPDGSEYVWIPTSETGLAVRDFGSYFSSSDSISGYRDETNLQTYRDMAASVMRYGGFYIGRFETSHGDDGLPVSKRVTDGSGNIWVRYAPQDTDALCRGLYPGNGTVRGFMPWGANWDTVLQWLIDSGCRTRDEIVSDSTGWGNYSNDTFSPGATGNLTGMWEETSSNNIYDLAGNNWEWTQERKGNSYVMRGGGYNLMGGACPGSSYPAALRDPLPGNDHHPNVTFRIGLYLI